MHQSWQLRPLYVSGLSKDEQPRTTEDLIHCLSLARDSGRKTICVVENTSKSVTESLQRSYNLDTAFFDAHYEDPSRSETDPWRKKSWHNPLQDSRVVPHTWQQLVGLFECHDRTTKKAELEKLTPNHLRRRIVAASETHPLSASTVISYCRVSDLLYIFLVDPPLKQKSRQPGASGSTPSYLCPTLRFPYSANREGLLIPRFPDQYICSPMQTLVNAFEHQWQVDLIFSTPYTFPNVPMLYILSNSIWTTQYQNLDASIKDICLRKIRDRRKGRDLVDSLHDLREYLSNLRVSLEETVFYAADGVQDYYKELKRMNPNMNMRRTPVEGHEATKQSADQLHVFFTENIQLLLGIISIQDAQHSIQQTHQSTILTALATVYLPLSLATSVFGMNLQEMNGSGPKIWIFVIVCAVLLVLTSVIVLFIFKRSIPNVFIRSEKPRNIAAREIDKKSATKTMEQIHKLA